MASLEVIVDTREPKWLADLLAEFGAKVVRAPLPMGDVATDKVVIERKTLADLAASVVDGRLWDQLNRMAASQRAFFLVVHGFESGPVDLLPWSTVLGAVASVAVRYLVPVLWVPGARDAAELIYKICLKAEEGKLGRPRAPRPKGYDYYSRLARLLRVPRPVAKSLMDEFGTVRRLAEATPEEIQRVRGVGRLRAERIWRALNARPGDT